jgi:hypothetical protein
LRVEELSTTLRPKLKACRSEEDIPTLAKSRPFATALRIGNVTVSQQALERALGVKLDRYGLQRSGELHFAQFNFPDGDDVWKFIIEFFKNCGFSMVKLLQDGAIGQSCVDFAFEFTRDWYTLSVEIPSDVAETIGRSGVDIEVSIYPASDEAAEAVAGVPQDGR